jgi:hypothetical protein
MCLLDFHLGNIPRPRGQHRRAVRFASDAPRGSHGAIRQDMWRPESRWRSHPVEREGRWSDRDQRLHLALRFARGRYGPMAGAGRRDQAGVPGRRPNPDLLRWNAPGPGVPNPARRGERGREKPRTPGPSSPPRSATPPIPRAASCPIGREVGPWQCLSVAYSGSPGRDRDRHRPENVGSTNILDPGPSRRDDGVGNSGRADVPEEVCALAGPAHASC